MGMPWCERDRDKPLGIRKGDRDRDTPSGVPWSERDRDNPTESLLSISQGERLRDTLSIPWALDKINLAEIKLNST